MVVNGNDKVTNSRAYDSKREIELERKLRIVCGFINLSLTPEKINIGKAFFVAEDFKRMNDACLIADKYRNIPSPQKESK